ncbi:MAG: hypothetical protein BZY81_08310 [SAR202 cluster bacterium Io17-Chloro-G4]|nr:MAG: hypothetical protein BZY81_08310 [SAR202 cluster bacterium Io17-Chloro-G4]
MGDGVRCAVAWEAAIVGEGDGWWTGVGVKVAVPPQARTVATKASHQNDFMSEIPTPRTGPGANPGPVLC